MNNVVLVSGVQQSDSIIQTCVLSLQSCPSLCNLKGCSLPGSSVHGILQTGILDRVAISYSRGSSQPRDQTHISYHLLHW